MATQEALEHISEQKKEKKLDYTFSVDFEKLILDIQL